LCGDYAACFGRELETAAEGKCQQAIHSGVGESVARNRLVQEDAWEKRDNYKA
jgi:hypothetical protein